MEKKKTHQPALTVDEQIENLISIGLIINDTEYARDILNKISYYRLIKAYSLNLKSKNQNYNNNVTFEQIVNLYSFNSNLRQLLFPEIEKIEISARCKISNYFSTNYGVLGYINSENFINTTYHSRFIFELSEEIKRNSNSPFVKNFKNNYISEYLPFYAVIELFSFGMLSKFYKNMKNSDKKIIASNFGIGYTYLESWLESISYVRNICAHYGRLYNFRLIKKPTLYKEYLKDNIQNDRIFAIILCLKYLLNKDEQWNSFITKLSALIEEYDEIEFKYIGFPDNWENLLI